MTLINRAVTYGILLAVILRSSTTSASNSSDHNDDGENILNSGRAEAYLRRRLSILDGTIMPPKDPKSTKAKGYVCAKGDVQWGANDKILSELPSFIDAYHQRHKFFEDNLVHKGVTNFGGFGLFHTFIMWAILRKLRPSVIVESGASKGYTSWMISKATEDWAPLFVRLDPKEVGWDGVKGNTNARKQINLRGEHFQDLTRYNWDNMYREHGLTSADKGTTLFILDDHQDQLERITRLSKLGFRHVLIDDNFVPGVGEVFSLKDACDASGDLRRSFNRSTNVRRPTLPNRCGNAHRDCKKLDPFQAQIAALELDTLVETYWEGPPLAPLDRPYEALIPYIEDKEKGRYEGPTEWTENHSRLVIESSKDPLYSDMEEAAKATGFSEMFLSFESSRYVNMVYVELIPLIL